MLAQPAVAAIRAIDPEQPVQDIRTMGQVLDGQLIPQRFSALLAKLVDIHLFQQSIRAEREHQYVRLGSYSATPPFCHTGASAVRATAIRKRSIDGVLRSRLTRVADNSGNVANLAR
jgi:hypothetical protein